MKTYREWLVEVSVSTEPLNTFSVWTRGDYLGRFSLFQGVAWRAERKDGKVAIVKSKAAAIEFVS
jgi:hypothetical protein